MTTIVDPAGTPTIVYNRSGTTIYELAVPVVDPVVPVSVERYSETTVVIIDTEEGFPRPAVELPDDAEIGDVVEIYVKDDVSNSETVDIVAPAGETFVASNVSANRLIGRIFRKISATRWGLASTGG